MKKHFSRYRKPKPVAGASGAPKASQPQLSDTPRGGTTESSSSASVRNTIEQAAGSPADTATHAADIASSTPSDGNASLAPADTPNVGDVTMNALSTSIAILQSVAEALKGVPLVKSISGIILELIKIKDVCLISFSPHETLIPLQEHDTNDRSSQELLEKIAGISLAIGTGLKRIDASRSLSPECGDDSKLLEDELNKYQRSVGHPIGKFSFINNLATLALSRVSIRY